jgi:hypothetical protein
MRCLIVSLMMGGLLLVSMGCDGPSTEEQEFYIVNGGVKVYRVAVEKCPT